MKTSKLFWGFLFVALGLLTLYTTITGSGFSVNSLLRYWPLVFVFWGISLMVSQNYIRMAFASFAGLFVALIIYSVFYTGYSFFDGDVRIGFNNHHENEVSNYYKIPYDSTVTNAKFKIEAGAGKFRLESNTEELVEINQRGILSYVLDSKNEDGKYDINFSMSDSHIDFSKNSISNKLNINLNKNFIWDIDLRFGAAKLDFDFSELKVNNLIYQGGASSIYFQFGELVDTLNVTMESHVSKVTISIPKNSGCVIVREGELSSFNLKDFVTQGNGIYKTENFDSSEKKIFLELNTDVSKLKVERY